MAKIAIVGSRDFKLSEMVTDYVARLPKDTEVVSGGARGVDTWAEYAARTHGLSVKIFPARWKELGRSAGFARNQDIVGYADEVVAFWDGKSRGTEHTIKLALWAGKLLDVYTAEEE